MARKKGPRRRSSSSPRGRASPRPRKPPNPRRASRPRASTRPREGGERKPRPTRGPRFQSKDFTKGFPRVTGPRKDQLDLITYKPARKLVEKGERFQIFRPGEPRLWGNVKTTRQGLVNRTTGARLNRADQQRYMDQKLRALSFSAGRKHAYAKAAQTISSKPQIFGLTLQQARDAIAQWRYDHARAVNQGRKPPAFPITSP